MLPRERVQAALEFRPVDIVPVEYHPSPAGIWEHGAALRRLWEQYPQDFGDSKDFPDSRPDPQFLNGEGRYEELHRDEWGVLWHQLIFGVYGHPIERPLDDWANLDRFEPPPVPPISGEEFQRERAKALLHMERYYLKSGWISMFETMHALRRFEDVLMDLSDDVTEINILADKILDYQLRTIRYLLARGVDAIQFGDDFGTSSSLMISPKTWRRSFKPRYERLFKEVHNAGKAVFFHTCGKASRILEDLAELDIDAVWPQLQSYEQGELARFCRKHGIAIALHPDRGNLMTRGEPSEIAAAVEKLAEEFTVADGGAWFYVEIDSGFPLRNVTALIESIAKLRNQR